MSAVLLLIDFEKAFDTIKWSFLDEILKYFNFGEIFGKWVRIIYTDVKIIVLTMTTYMTLYIYSEVFVKVAPSLLIYFC